MARLMDNPLLTANRLSINLRATDNLLLKATVRLSKGMRSLLSRVVTDSLSKGTRDSLNRGILGSLNRVTRDKHSKVTPVKLQWVEARPRTSVTSSKFSPRLYRM